jgi:carbon monoxide dehydrogenase subunit G
VELEHSFAIPTSSDHAWDVLLDAQRVASCMPGLSLMGVEPGLMRATIKVKVGPIRMAYTGTARLASSDRASEQLLLEASGEETKGAGTASATVRFALEDRDGATEVAVRTTLTLTGKPAQFGRGVVQGVTVKLVDQFAANLAEMITSGQFGTARSHGSPAPGVNATESARNVGRDLDEAPHAGDPERRHELNHADDVSAALRGIVTDYGADALSRPAIMASLLADLLPDAPRIARLLIAAAEDHIAEMLQEHISQGMEPNTATRLAASAFADSTMFTPDACAWAVGTIAAALNLTDRNPTVVVTSSGSKSSQDVG